MGRGRSAIYIIILLFSCASPQKNNTGNDTTDSDINKSYDKISDVDLTSSKEEDRRDSPVIKKYGEILDEPVGTLNANDESIENKAGVVENKLISKQYKDAYQLLMKHLKEKEYVKAANILKELSLVDSDMEYLYMLILDRLGEHEKPVNYWEEKIRHYLQSKGINIAKMVFCRKINDFGRYEKIESNEFMPGGAILLYIELENFSYKRANNGYKVNLFYTWELFDSNGQQLPIWDEASDSVRSDDILFKRRITDYHQSFLLPLPKNIAGGDYKLKVKVKDINTGNETTKEKALKILYIN